MFKGHAKVQKSHYQRLLLIKKSNKHQRDEKSNREKFQF